MARRKNNGKPTLLTEATVTKFMKLANLEDLSGDFKRTMGYKNGGPERHWEQPGLSKYSQTPVFLCFDPRDMLNNFCFLKM